MPAARDAPARAQSNELPSLGEPRPTDLSAGN